MHLTAVFKLRANPRDRRLLRLALARWTAALAEGLDRARARQRDLLRCLAPREESGSERVRLVLDRKRLHSIAGECVTGPRMLHSSARASLVVALEEALAGWLGQYLAWLERDRSGTKPRFPAPSASSRRSETARYLMALGSALRVTTAAEEAGWLAEVASLRKPRDLPMYFGAATSGDERGPAHCGLLRREDGKYFALLTLWPRGDRLGQPLQRAENRASAGTLRNVRAPVSFEPTPRGRASILVPLEMGRGHRQLFFGRAIPTSAELVLKGDAFYLHVAFAYPSEPPRALTGTILSVQCGIRVLVSAVALDGDGAILLRVRLSGEELTSRVSAVMKDRRAGRRRGPAPGGDHRAVRIKGHSLYRAGHLLIDLACRLGAEIVILRDPGARAPGRTLAWRHTYRFARIMAQLAGEAGLPPPRERTIYGPWTLCPLCGRAADAPELQASGLPGACSSCGAAVEGEFRYPHLLGLDTLRWRRPAEKRPPLDQFIRGIQIVRRG